MATRPAMLPRWARPPPPERESEHWPAHQPATSEWALGSEPRPALRRDWPACLARAVLKWSCRPALPWNSYSIETCDLLQRNCATDVLSATDDGMFADLNRRLDCRL